MNERIKTLAKAAGYDTITESYMKALGFNPEKFAQLIVKECMQVADDGMAQVTMKVEWPSYHIKKHFGVE
jgi:hypothetical protein